MTSSPFSFTDVSSLNKAAGDPLRLEILRVLAQDSYGVLELCEIFEHKQSGMSHHLKVLAEASLVAKRREGNSIFYSRALPSDDLGQLQEALYNTLDGIGVSESVAQRLAIIQQDRASQSQSFFIEQSDKFKAQQDLIAEYPVYGEAVTEMLHKTPMSEYSLAIEVGPGAGECLPIIAKQFERVLALDNAPTMLEKAKTFCEQRQVANVEFYCGDTKRLTEGSMAADCVVMNMVLHHTPSPADIFLDISKSLKMQGALLITDLCRHDQDWAKSACGDLWLGFDPEELTRWAALAGFTKGHSNYLALRNGFQIQLQQFFKTS